MRKAWPIVAILVVAWLPQAGKAQDTGNGLGILQIIKAMDLGWRPEPHETEPFNQPIAMNGNAILNYYSVDAVALRRSAGQFSGGQADLSVGPRLILGRGLSDRDAFEIGYLAQYQMNRSFFDPGPGPIGLNNRADYRSVFNSGELNLRHWVFPQLSLIAGFRYLNWHEDMDTAFDSPAGSLNHVFHTSNNLYGGQIGADFKHMFSDRLGIESINHFGIYANRAAMDATANVPGLGGFAASAAGTRTSFIGEIGLVGTYSFTSYLKARAGYQLMWIDGIALAPGQVNPATLVGPASLDTRGNSFLHGAVVGLELWW